ncbi:hypothetical protein E1262_03210 [Jiangella aurantiaca]|uniref:Glycoside hydrolase family 38 N-terminal domain-containing protein n=1 Tax=Jiangella aurantiaca TaxID=2530373 RepID=A0A4R5AIH8_9ACTN|nr:hypothetical protein [Jiangella aurantiaca]TDD72331.1 hypothetical protein E1262_03210 [Jiangella aurantiaca]
MPAGSRVREILLVPHTHHDVGYTDSPRLIDRQHRDIVRHVLDLCDRTEGDGDAALRWTFEISRPVIEFVRRAGRADVDRLRRLVLDGRVAVTAGYLNLTQLPGERELERMYEALAPLAEAGIPVRTEQHGDVNGLSWGSVPAMRRHGVSRLVMALNPDHGRPPFPQPSGFWWEGPDGSRVFVLLSTHYGIGEEWGIIDGDVRLAAKRIAALVDELDERDDYPFDVAVVHAANDNRWPTLEFLPLMAQWNELHPDRPMRLATMDDALDRLERVAASVELPVVRGEWADWWSHGHGSTARELAVYRQARTHQLTGEVLHALSDLRGDGAVDLASVLGHSRGPVRLRSRAELTDDLAFVDEQLWLFGEHTWGSWESFSRPDSVYTASHWNAKAGFAYGAYDIARHVATEGLFRLLASGSGDVAGSAMHRTGLGTDRTCLGGPSIVVMNPTARRRTEPVLVELAGQRTTVVTATVEPFGVTTVELPAEPVSDDTAGTVETPEYAVTVDPGRGGVVSLVDRRTGADLVDAGSAFPLGALVAEMIPADSEHPFLVRPRDFHPDFPGPEFDRAAATSSAPVRVMRGTSFTALTWSGSVAGVNVSTTLRLYPSFDLIDLDVTVAKAETLAPESLFVTFPFAVADPRFLVETAGAAFVAEHEQLSDTSKDWYAIQHAAGVSGTGSAVLWGSYDAPLAQFGGFQTGKWARSLDAPAGHVNSWLMNNLHFTNFRAAQGGTQTFRYRFAARSHDAAAVRRFGDDLLHPLVSRQYAGHVAPSGAAGLVVSPGEDVLVDLRPADADGVVLARLRSLSAAPVRARLSWAAAGVVEATAPAGTWQPLGTEGGLELELTPHAVADVWLRRSV